MNRKVSVMRVKEYVKSLNQKSIDELKIELVDMKKRLFNLRFQQATNQLKNTSEIKIVRRNIARIQTLITQKLVKPKE